jgi:predicted dehydrogenase
VHQKRLADFMQALRDELSRGRKYRLVSITCSPDPCSFTQIPPDEILEKARSAGARLLLFGGIHKMSTLIQWAKVQVVDLQTDKPVFDRLLTFRGDTDEAWQRAEAFIVEQVNALDIAH